MSSKFLKPEITNIGKATWDTIKIRWQFWSLLVFAIISAPVFSIAPFILIIFYILIIQNKIRTSFWKQFAGINGWQYKSNGNPEQEFGIMFKQGNVRHISNEINGNIENRQFRIFNYQFSIGSGKHKITYYYTIFAFKFNGSFPHIYLNNKCNSYGVNIGEAILLPSEFEEKFSLSAPRKYEIEALEIFTPDILVNLLDNDFPHDVEFVKQEVLIFTNGQINNFEQLEKEFNKALEIENLLDKKLDKFKFDKIGDMSHLL